MLGHSLHDILWNLNVDELLIYLKLFAPSTKIKTKAAIVDELKLNYKSLTKWIDSLGELEKSALAEAVHHWNGEYKHSSFVAKYGHSIDFGSVRQNRQTPLRPIGLFFFRVRDGSGLTYIIPSDLQEDIKKLLAPPTAKGINTVNDIPGQISFNLRWRKDENLTYPFQIRNTEYTSQFEILNLLNLIQAEKISVSDKTRLPSAQAQKNIDQSLFDGDFFGQVNSNQFSKTQYDDDAKIEGPVRAFAWPMLIQGGKLAQLSGTKLKLTTKGKSALSTHPHETLKLLWSTWIKSDLFDEFKRIDIVRGQTGNGARGMSTPSGRKNVIDAAMVELPPNEWVDIDEFFKFIQANNFDFNVTNDPWNLYICEKQYGSLGYDGYHNWNLLEARYILCLLFEYAATLGIIDIAYTPAAHTRSDYANLWGTDDNLFFSRYDGLKYIRLNSFGAYCLNVTTNYVPPVLENKKTISILPNFDIIVTKELGLADKSMLEFLASNKSQLVWTLDEKKILSSLEEGKNLDQLKNYLLALSGELFPPSVAQFFNDIESRVTSLKPKGEAYIVICKDETLAALIANDIQMKKISVWNTKEYLFIQKDHISTFKRNLKKMGHAITI